MADWFSRVVGQKVNGVRVVPLVLKIVTIFTVFLLISNFTTNYINLMLNRGEQIRLLNQLLVKDLKELHVFAGNQFQIFNFNPDLEGAVDNIETAALRNHRGERSLSIGVTPDGAVFFQASAMDRTTDFPDTEALETMNDALAEGVEEGTINFEFAGFDYFGVYKYNDDWEIFQIRGEELSEFYADSERIFRQVSLIILGLSILFVVIGILILRFILRFVRALTDNIMRMQAEQSLELMDLTGAPNDDVTYLGVAFNSLSNTI
ncbi:MAG: adenylate/guanylate cyclase domain-containing protein, partial [Alkalispirochaeta sp.]